MYKLLILDDEELIRKGLISRLKYMGMEFQAIYEASTGIQALDILDREFVDIAITDIRMPDMDGLSFIGKAKKKRAEMKFIILSGYAEFDYAEEAIRLGVKGYLLKPISNEDLQRVFSQVENQLAQEEGARRAMSMQDRLISENKAFSIDREVNSMLGIPQTENTSPDIYKNMKMSHPELCNEDNHDLRLIIINIEPKSYMETGFKLKDMELIKYSIKNVFEEIKTSCSKLIVDNLSNPTQLYAVLGNVRKQDIRGEAERFFLKMLYLFEEELGVHLTFGVSGLSRRLCAEVLQQAEDALKERLVYEHSSIYFYDEIETISEINFPSVQLNMLNQYLERRDIAKVRAVIIEIFGKEYLKKYHIHYIRIMWVRVLNLIFRNFSLEILENENAQMWVNCFLMADKMSNVEQLIEHYMDIVLLCIERSGNIDTNAKDKIRLAVSFIDRHFAEDISINRLADKYEMSPNYFSSLFKKEMNISAVNYIVDVRMRRAKKFLSETNKNVVEIAKTVGYEDSHYFYRVFKKNTGMTPIRYRQYING